MKIRTIVILSTAVSLLAAVSPAAADIVPMTYVDPIDFVPDQKLVERDGVSIPFDYEHDNPAVAPEGPYSLTEFEMLADQGLISDVTLCIRIQCINRPGELVRVMVDPVTDMGFTNIGTMTTNGLHCFDLQDAFGPAGGLGEDLPVRLTVEGPDPDNECWVEESQLSVSIVPAPTAVMLGAIGFAAVARLRRRLA